MYLIVAVIGLIGLYFLYNLNRKTLDAPLPPGPKPLPIVGNIRDLPDPDRPDWLHWHRHQELYGPISTVSVFGQRIVILNSFEYANELLEKRSSVHSDRPHLPMAELSGWGDGLALLKYGKRFHAYRKNMHREIGSKTSLARFNDTQRAEVGRFLLRLVEKPNDVVAHARKLAGALILKITYGYTIEPRERDPLVDIVDEAVENFSYSARPGTWIVDFAPFLRHLPTWFPGATFHRYANLFRKNTTKMADLPFAFVKQQMAEGKLNHSYVANLLEAEAAAPGTFDETVIKWSAGSLYGGGADTTVSTISSFFLAMALYPEVQKKAQEEIDRVVGQGRLPDFNDRENLPYIDAVLKEALRWHPIGPMGLPHRAMDDDVIGGYLVPKGSIILANIWGMCHDPTDYADPKPFKPERFLGENPERDPHLLSFGFGRRVCPGRMLADANVWLTIAQSLASFSIKKVEDFEPEFLPGVISHPAPYDVEIRPRTAKYEEMIRFVEKEFPWEKSHGEILRSMST